MHEAGEQGHGPFGVADAGIAFGGQTQVGDVAPRLVAIVTAVTFAACAACAACAGPAGWLAQRRRGDLLGTSRFSNGTSPACTGRRRERRCSPPAPWSAGSAGPRARPGAAWLPSRLGAWAARARRVCTGRSW